MLFRLRLLLAILCVALLTTMTLAAPSSVGCGAGGACVQVEADDPPGDEAPDGPSHLCFHVCHAAMVLPASFILLPEPLTTDPVVTAARLSHGTSAGPPLLPPIA